MRKKNVQICLELVSDYLRYLPLQTEGPDAWMLRLLAEERRRAFNGIGFDHFVFFTFFVLVQHLGSNKTS